MCGVDQELLDVFNAQKASMAVKVKVASDIMKDIGSIVISSDHLEQVPLFCG